MLIEQLSLLDQAEELVPIVAEGVLVPRSKPVSWIFKSALAELLRRGAFLIGLPFKLRKKFVGAGHNKEGEDR